MGRSRRCTGCNNQSVSALVENYGVFTLAKVKGNADLDLDFSPFITPNGDGYYDTWTIKPSENIEILTIHIFYRYGKLLKVLNSGSVGWDGTYNGKQLLGTDYWFVANYKDLIDNTAKQFRSHIALKY